MPTKPWSGRSYEAQCELLRIPNRTDDFAGCARVLRRVSQPMPCAMPIDPQLADTIQRAGATALAQHDAGPLLTALEQALVALADTPTTRSEDAGGPRTGIQAPRNGRPSACFGSARRRIEALVNLAGELVVAKNALAHSAKRVEQDLGRTRGREVGPTRP